MNCLLCFNEDIEGNGELGLVQAVLSSITVWCNEKLQDYHLHFLQVCFFKEFILLLIICAGKLAFG